MNCLYKNNDMRRFHDRYRIDSTRLQDYDYSSDGLYFVTICTKNRELLFGDIVDGEMICSGMGTIARECWAEIPVHFSSVRLDAFVMMPNHLHGIVVIENTVSDFQNGNHVETIHELSLQKLQIHELFQEQTREKRRRMLIPRIVGRFKMKTAKQMNQLRKTPGMPFWQKNYHDRIIRNEDELNRIRKYVFENPIHWEQDINHPDNIHR